MCMEKSKYIHLIALLGFIFNISAVPNITLFFKPAIDIERISKKLQKPGKLAKYMVKGYASSPVEGIIGLYGGYVTASDYDGQISFPRRHQSTTIDIIIAPEIAPVALFENTVSRWVLPEGVSAVRYICEKSYNAEKKEYYWNMKEVGATNDRDIPMSALIIIGKPSNFEVQVGTTKMEHSSNLVLPDIYVKKGFNSVKNAIYALTIRHLFKPVEAQQRRESLETLSQITN